MKNTLQTFELNQEVALQGSLVELDQIELEQVSGGVVRGVVSGVLTELLFFMSRGATSGYKAYVENGHKINHSITW